MKFCHACGAEIATAAVVGRKDACPGCRAELRCCLNCRYYERGAYNSCRESQADRVLDKERANFCDYFRFREGGRKDSGAPAGLARERLEGFFKK